ncbi:RNA-directed DNA polymerase [Cerasicoccus frondis]|uniref:RNA-directed DNA polymerase n=1 Tax=Cerasicoccus frondis TaxID=490090 RepID=UPI0028525906|nr:RNA-directed DNA polymerase [Cerasicoccus frondis]
MDHQTALRRLRSREILSAAFDYAIFDRQNGDHFFDPIEIEYSISNRESIIAEIISELDNVEAYQPRTAFAYFPPKNHLCDRRMVYIPLKDLVVRYAITILFSEEVEYEILDECFANRRATGDAQNIRFTEEFATGGWPRFCEWQQEKCDEHNVLVKADISAFYDSVSHEYLVDAIERHLSIPRDTEIIRLFMRLLKTRVIYYSQATGQIAQPSQLHQGLPIGDGVEGYLANIYLKDVDDAMTSLGATYGRYVDDIRIFGSSRVEVLGHLRSLQECLLNLGLNLNSSKTTIAENEAEMDDLRSSNYLVDASIEIEVENAGLQILDQEIDAPFEEFDRVFNEGDDIDRKKDGKDFCKYMSSHTADGHPVLSLEDRAIWHVNMLADFVEIGRGASKHATWLLVQTALYRGVSPDTQEHCRSKILELLSSESVCDYAKYRCLHHLLKKRGQRQFRFFDQLEDEERQSILYLLPAFLSARAFELNLIGIYMASVSDMEIQEIRRRAHEHSARSCEPVRSALSRLNDQTLATHPVTTVVAEPDERPDPY